MSPLPLRVGIVGCGNIAARHATVLRELPETTLVAVSDIIRFRADGGLVHAHTSAESPATDYTLAELEARAPGTFVRASRADLVSLSHIQGLAGNGDGSATLTLSDGTDVRVSRRRAAAVRDAVHHL